MERAGQQALGAAGRRLAYTVCLAWATLGAACTDGTTPDCEAGQCAVGAFGGDAAAATDATDDASADDAVASVDGADASAGDGGAIADTGAGGG